MDKSQAKASKLRYRTIRYDADRLLSDDQRDRIGETVRLTSEVFFAAARRCNEMKKASRGAIQKELYREFADKYEALPSQILQTTLFRAGEAVKSQNSNVPAYNKKRREQNKRIAKRNAKRAKEGLPPIPYKEMLNKWELKPKKAPNNYRLDGRTLSKRGDNITFSAVGKRIAVPFAFPEWFSDKYDVSEQKLQSGTVGIRDDGTVIMTLSFSCTKEEVPRTAGETVGIDLGIKHKYASSRGELHDSRHINKIKRKYFHNRRILAQKGTPSAKRKLKKSSGKERRFMRDANHCMTKRLADDPSVMTYALEDLTNIRIKTKGKKHNRNMSGWSFKQFLFFLDYKCKANGISVGLVDPAYTSVTCNVCGSRGERHKGSFKCKVCGHKAHADINASMNIRNIYLRQRSAGRAPSAAQTTETLSNEGVSIKVSADRLSGTSRKPRACDS
jgi:IS605 OrfB family transposase